MISLLSPLEQLFPSTNYDGFCRQTANDGKVMKPIINIATIVSPRPFFSAVSECHQKCRTTKECAAFSIVREPKMFQQIGQSSPEKEKTGMNCFLYGKVPFTPIKGNGYEFASCYVMQGMKFENR